MMKSPPSRPKTSGVVVASPVRRPVVVSSSVGTPFQDVTDLAVGLPIAPDVLLAEERAVDHVWSVAPIEAVAHPRLGDEVAGRAGRARACGGSGRGRRGGSWSRVSYCGPQTSCSSWRWETSLPGLRTSSSTICHSVGVRCTSAPSRVDALGGEVDGEVGRGDDGVLLRRRARRSAARSRASSSSMPNGFVT